MNTIEGNKLIADFEGRATSILHGELCYADWDGMHSVKYHTSWDWIMPVVEKIQSLGFKFIIGDSNRVTVYNKDYDWRNGSTSDSLIECVWHGVTQFIKWYNSQTTPEGGKKEGE